MKKYENFVIGKGELNNVIYNNMLSSMLMLISSADVYACAFFVCVFDALELHAEVFVVVSSSRDAIAIHPVKYKLRELEVAYFNSCKIFPHVHDEDIINSLGNGCQSWLRYVVIGFRLLAG